MELRVGQESRVPGVKVRRRIRGGRFGDHQTTADELEEG